MKHLPLKLRGVAASSALGTLALSPSDCPERTERIWIFGAERALPIDIREGVYLVHLIRDGNVEAYRTTLSPSAKPSWEKLWSQSLFLKLHRAELQAALEASLPSALKKGAITVMVPGASGESTALLISAPASAEKPVAAADTPLAKTPVQNFEMKLNDELAFNSTPAKNENSLFKSKWFWIATGAVVAGVSGYFIYDATQNSSTVKTP